MHLVYAMYLDVLVYYHKFKTIQSHVHDKEVTEEKTVLGRKVDLRSSRSEGDDAEQDAGQDDRDKANQVVAEDPSEHYALFTNNGWNENKRMRARRKFNFN
ncbi:hypothetical protein Hanom_Chr01g00021571 [Helianthus anomalus]